VCPILCDPPLQSFLLGYNQLAAQALETQQSVTPDMAAKYRANNQLIQRAVSAYVTHQTPYDVDTGEMHFQYLKYLQYLTAKRFA